MQLVLWQREEGDPNLILSVSVRAISIPTGIDYEVQTSWRLLVEIKAADEHCQKHNPVRSLSGRVYLYKDPSTIVVTPRMARCHLQHRSDKLAGSPQRDHSWMRASSYPGTKSSRQEIDAIPSGYSALDKQRVH